jgi:hyperosmotically inducible protein
MHQHSVGALILGITFAGICAITTAPARAQTQPDNTKVNTRDRDKTAVTADQQRENAADRDLTQKIRRALTKDKTLSSYAHNVKIITQGGQVTLRGPVRSEDEKQTIEHTATDVAGAGHVTSELSIAPKKP